MNSIEIISLFQKAPRIYIPQRWITEKTNLDLFAEKLINCPDPDSGTNPSLEHRLQLLPWDINMPAMESVPI